MSNYEKDFQFGFDDGRRLAREVRSGELTNASGRATLLSCRENVRLFPDSTPYSAGVIDGFTVDAMAYGNPIPAEACDAQDHDSEDSYLDCLDCHPLVSGRKP